MKERLLASLSVASLVIGLGPHSVASTPAKSPHSKKTSAPRKETREDRLKKSAPADEYFGKLKMSYIGINNTLRDEGIRAGEYTTDSNIIHTVGLAEDALSDWRKKYPSDPQLARTFFLMGKMYAKIWTAGGQGSAAYYYHQLESQFGNSYFGKLLHTQLAKGFTEHILLDAQPCPAPLPTAIPTPSAQPRLRKGETPAPSPTPAPTESPTPSVTPSPGPTPPTDKRIHLSLIPQPCFTPTPIPSPTPTPSPLPSGSLTPAPSMSPPGSPVPVPSGSPSALPPIHTMVPATPTPVPPGRITPTPSHT
ncbi:MAG: hypothetical protein ABR584_12275 [Candidatus Baltobacteraceae bacterium]